MMSVTIDPTEIRAPAEPVRRRPGRALLLALPVGLSVAGLAAVCALATWPADEVVKTPVAPIRAAAVNIADWPEIKDGVPQVVTTREPALPQATPPAVAGPPAEVPPSSLPVQKIAPLATDARAFAPTDGTAGPLSPAPFEPAAAPVQAATPVLAPAPSEEVLPRAATASADPVAAVPDVAPAPVAPVPIQPAAASASPQESTVAVVAPAAEAGLRGPVPAVPREAAQDTPAPPARAVGAAQKAKAEARQERAQALKREAATSAKPAPKKAEKVATPASKKTEPAKVAGGAQAGAGGAVATAAATGEPTKSTTQEERVRVFGMTLPGFVPTGRKIKETVGNLGDAVMSLPGKL